MYTPDFLVLLKKNGCLFCFFPFPPLHFTRLQRKNTTTFAPRAKCACLLQKTKRANWRTISQCTVHWKRSWMRWLCRLPAAATWTRLVSVSFSVAFMLLFFFSSFFSFRSFFKISVRAKFVQTLFPGSCKAGFDLVRVFIQRRDLSSQEAQASSRPCSSGIN